MGKEVKELKSKKDVLMAFFRRHLKRKRDSMHSGEGTQELYEPNWFPYRIMESFLIKNYTSKSTKNTQNVHDDDKENIPEPSKNHRKKRSRSPEKEEEYFNSTIKYLSNDLKKIRDDPVENVTFLISSMVRRMESDDQAKLCKELIDHVFYFRDKHGNTIGFPSKVVESPPKTIVINNNDISPLETIVFNENELESHSTLQTIILDNEKVESIRPLDLSSPGPSSSGPH